MNKTQNYENSELSTLEDLNEEFYFNVFRKNGISGEPFRQLRSVPTVQQERELIRKYLETVPESVKNHYRQIQDSVGPMSDNCRIVLLVPARFEENRIKTFLNSIKTSIGTDSNHTQYEVLILENYAHDEKPDNVRNVVDSFVKENKNRFPPVVFLTKVFNEEDRQYGLGLSRKYLTDYALYRSLQRKNQRHNLILASCDADLTYLQKNALDMVVKLFASDCKVDMIRGVHDRDREAYAKNSLLYLERRSWLILERLLAQNKYRPENNDKYNFTWNRVVAGGWNTYFRASVYAAIYGYSRLRLLEDLDIGHRISIYRGEYSAARKKFVPCTRSIIYLPIRCTSAPQRFIYALHKQTDPYGGENYDGFFNDSVNKFVRHKSIDECLEIIKHYADCDEKSAPAFQAVLQRLLPVFKKVLNDYSEAVKCFSRLMLIMGFNKGDYEINDSHEVKINNYQNFRNQFNRFKGLPSYHEKYI